MINAFKILVSIPKQILLRSTQFEIRFMYREIEFIGVVDQLIPIVAHTFPAPRKYCILINGKRCVWNNQIFINTNYISITLTCRTRPIRIIKAEQMHVGFQKAHPV